ncbi:hypothetical protein HMPREF0454_01394 [Hafnia alvei ATCC 51873]|uniref:Uncharacterized protein n=1 Tax=Hafnia alvei ATCC 51873 TaxID=1002364 RepID=G9Y4D0_HAFAL|nr:hypothetical protein HMPREF0454_01394 [Hafnia alvei ATCC 51873]
MFIYVIRKKFKIIKIHINILFLMGFYLLCIETYALYNNDKTGQY